MRLTFTLLHRWFGLTIAGFLFVSGVTGAIISWDHELDDWLNPELSHVDSRGPYLAPQALAARIEQADARARVTYMPMHAQEGESATFSVSPRVDPATGTAFEIGYNQIYLDPVTGNILGKREWGKVAVDRAHIIPFLYQLHYSLHIPTTQGIYRWGLWLMGIIALIWTIDCFIGFYLTLPGRHAPNPARPGAVTKQLARGFWQRWKPAWKIKTGGSAYRINFDIHRAFGLWFWMLLFILAVSAASLNLYREVAQPVVNLFSSFTPTPFDVRTPRAEEDPIEPQKSFAEIQASAEQEARRRGWKEPVGAIFYSPPYGVYGVRFFQPGDDHGAAGVGPAALYYDGIDGRYLGDRVPWSGTAGDLFLQVQFPLHSGRIAGLPGRILISFMGLAVAALSVTGVVIWWRKRRARQAVKSRARETRGEAVGEIAHTPAE